MARKASAVVCREHNQPVQVEQIDVDGPERGEVLVRLGACGVCHSDAATVDGLFPIEWPRVPGHEVVGRIDVGTPNSMMKGL